MLEPKHTLVVFTIVLLLMSFVVVVVFVVVVDVVVVVVVAVVVVVVVDVTYSKRHCGLYSECWAIIYAICCNEYL